MDAFTRKISYDLDAIFSINTSKFLENIWYLSIDNNSKMFLKTENNIIFIKNIYGCVPYCWIRYEISGNGKHEVYFKIKSNKNIINYDFIKLEKSKILYKKNILENTWTEINVIIDIIDNNDFIYLFFDNFYDTIKLKFKDIKITKINMIN